MNFAIPQYYIVFIAIIVFIVTYWFGRKNTPMLVRILRFSVLSMLLFLLFQPALQYFKQKEKPQVAVLLDCSKSMSFSNRFRDAKKFLEKNLSLLKKFFSVDLLKFADNFSILDENALKESLPVGSVTDISKVLTHVSNSNDYDAAILLSDGINNSKEDIYSVVKNLKIPVFTFYTEEKQLPVDISIFDMSIPDFVFKNVPVEISVIFHCSGCDGKKVTAYLKKGKDIIASKSKTIDGPVQKIDFEFISNKVGLETYKFEIAPLAEEKILVNNSKEFSIETIREKIRLLYICGQPNPEYYFLRYFLKSNPSVELISFVILRNPEDIAVVPDEQLSLIPFPSREIFAKDLFDFDVLILENFNYSRFYIQPQQLNYIAQFVKKGGGLLMIAGDNAFGKGAYRGTAIEEVLPVVMDEPNEPIEEGLFNLRVVNFDHPISKLSEEGGRKESERIWNELPPLDGCQRLRAKTGADGTTVIAVHPYLKLETGNAVCIACGEGEVYGKGRSVAIGSNTTWRWLLNPKGDTQAYYTKFWENVINWLSQSELTKELRISILQKKYFIGENVLIKLLTSNDKLKKFKPVVNITDPLFKKASLEDIIPTPTGWQVSFRPSLSGTYRVEAKIESLLPSASKKILARDSHLFSVSSEVTTEEFDLQLNTKLLNDIATFTGGISAPLSNFSISELNSIVQSKIQPVVTEQLYFVSLPVVFFVIVGLLLFEWVIRRLQGML
ncbi:MAG: glutamine amidotransferase [Elusimicrobiota bacterium]|nr:glutamine amidotransferase [Elusimicrobiota bacterium]